MKKFSVKVSDEAREELLKVKGVSEGIRDILVFDNVDSSALKKFKLLNEVWPTFPYDESEGVYDKWKELFEPLKDYGINLSSYSSEDISKYGKTTTIKKRIDLSGPKVDMLIDINGAMFDFDEGFKGLEKALKEAKVLDYDERSKLVSELESLGIVVTNNSIKLKDLDTAVKAIKKVLVQPKPKKK